MKNTLIFYFYANENTIDSEVNKLHLKCLKTFKNAFDEANIYIALDDINDALLLSRIRYKFLDVFGGMNIRLSFIPLQYNSYYGLSELFKEEIFKKLNDYEYIYFVNNLISLKNEEYSKLYTLITSMYYNNLNNINEVQKQFLTNINGITNGSYLYCSNIGRNVQEFFYEENYFWINCYSIYGIICANFLEEKLENAKGPYYINDFFKILNDNGGICLSTNEVYYNIDLSINRIENVIELSQQLNYLTDNYYTFTEEIKNI